VASNAQSRDFQLSQIVPHKKIYLDVPDISNTEEVRESDSWKKAVSASILLANLTINDGETFIVSNNLTELLTTLPADQTAWFNEEGPRMKGQIEIIIKNEVFGKPISHILSLEYHSQYGSFWNLRKRQDGDLKYFGRNEWPKKGPANIEIRLKPYRMGPTKDDKGWFVEEYLQHWRMIYRKSIASYAQSQTQLQALVLPKNTKNTRLVVESSEDLVNWKLDTPGPKTTTNRERFFRLRAVKE